GSAQGRPSRAVRGGRGGRRRGLAEVLARHAPTHHAGALLQRRDRPHRRPADVRGRLPHPDDTDGAEPGFGGLLPLVRTFNQLEIGQGAAASWILAVIIVLLTAAQFRYSRWVHYG